MKHADARLASIHSFDEQFFIDEILLSISSEGFDFWIGLYKSSEGTNCKRPFALDDNFYVVKNFLLTTMTFYNLPLSSSNNIENHATDF